MGLGDVYLIAGIGLLLGWGHVLVATAVGCILGSIIHLIRIAVSKNKDHQLAFGPYLCLGTYITLVFGNQIIDWYIKYIIH